MRKKIMKLAAFLISVSILIAALKVINWLPAAFQEGYMKKYESIEKARVMLNLKDIYVPSYFPQSLVWPPSVILAQTKPFAAVIMEIKNTEKGGTALIITQTEAGKTLAAGSKINIRDIRERLDYKLKGKNTLLEVGTCKNNEPCSRISWNEGRYRMDVLSMSAPDELIRIAESMMH